MDRRPIVLARCLLVCSQLHFLTYHAAIALLNTAAEERSSLLCLATPPEHTENTILETTRRALGNEHGYKLLEHMVV